MKANFLLSLLASIITISSYAVTPTIEFTPNKEGAIYEKGEEIIMSCKVDDLTVPKLQYVTYHNGKIVDQQTVDIPENRIVEIKTSMDYAGWPHFQVDFADATGKGIRVNNKPLRYEFGAIVAPSELKAVVEEPADFDEFWDKAKAELAKVPMDVKITQITNLPEKAYKTHDVYDVQISCVGDMPVSGYLTIPKDAKPNSLPAAVTYHGAGVRSSAYVYYSKAMVLDINAHGIPNGMSKEEYTKLDKGELKDYRHRGKTDKDTIYFKNMYLRVLRALEYMKSRPEWDQKNLVSVGTSQGGAQAIVGAALDPQVNICSANVPALSDHAGELEENVRISGWPRLLTNQWRIVDPTQKADPKVIETSKYFDNIFFARRIKCETYISTGFADMSCPPTGVYVVYNNLPETTKKNMTTDFKANHSQVRDWTAAKRLRDLLGYRLEIRP